jgi:23S rRNA pseudouridine2605 synthase
MGPQRIQKLISRYGFASRRKAEQLILDGRVRVDGVRVSRLGAKADESAVIEVDGRVINREKKNVYLLLNKPRGYLCSRSDSRGRRLVYDLLPDEYRGEGVFSIGRLDHDTEGLLLLTNDGEFANQVGHPSGGLVKKYLVETRRDILMGKNTPSSHTERSVERR